MKLKAFLMACAIVLLVSCTKATGDSPQPQSPPCPWTLVYRYESETGQWFEQTTCMKVNGGTIYRQTVSYTRSCDPSVGVALVYVPDPPAK